MILSEGYAPPRQYSCCGQEPSLSEVYPDAVEVCPSRAVWFGLGIATVLAWPILGSLIGVGSAAGRRAQRKLEER